MRRTKCHRPVLIGGREQRNVMDRPAPVLRVSRGDGIEATAGEISFHLSLTVNFFFFPSQALRLHLKHLRRGKKKFDHKPVPAGVGSVRFRLRPPPLHVRPGRRAFETLEEGVGTMALKVASSRVI